LPLSPDGTLKIPKMKMSRIAMIRAIFLLRFLFIVPFL
jgi:hypothetical protein